MKHLENYDPNMISSVQTIRVTFMSWGYVGHIAYKMGGNCRGASILDTNFLENINQDDIDDFVENDCNLRYNEEYDTFEYTLTLPDGSDTLHVDDDTTQDLSDAIVCIEIINQEPEAD